MKKRKSAKHCCQFLKQQLNYGCPEHGDKCPDVVVFKGSRNGEYFLKAPNATYSAKFCPWCGKKLK